MSFLEGYALNYNSLALLEGFLLWFITFVTLSMLKEKSKALKWFIAVLFTGVLFLSGYVFSQGYYIENKIPRLIILAVIPYQHVCTVGFVFNFPNDITPRFSRYFLAFLFTIVTIVVGYLVFKALQTNIYYDFSGHFYELNIPQVFKVYGATVLFTTLSVQFLALWKWYFLPQEEKKGYGWFNLAFFLGYTMSAVLNLSNKLGFIDRSWYITFFSFMTTFAIFILLVAFVNNTKDRTTFLFKIIGASFTTFIFIFSILTLTILTDRENFYDLSKNSTWKGVLQEPNLDPNLVFIQTLEEGKFSYEYVTSDIEASLSSENFMKKLVLYNLLQNSTSEILEDFPGSLLENKVLAFYWKYLFVKSPTNEKDSILDTIPTVNKKFFLLYNKVKEIPEEEFRNKFLTFFEKEKNNFLGGDELLLAALNESSKENKELKEYILEFFSPLVFPNTRAYSFSKDGKNKLVNFYYINNNKIYQFAYNYISYREYIHKGAIVLFYLIILGTILFVAGMPVFLSRALIKPLGKLLVNVGEVRKGNLDVYTPIKVNDEIGYLSRAFNMMVKSIRESEKKLKEYAETLEEKVKERTRELAESLSQIKSLKEQQDGDYFLTTLLLKPFGVSEKEGAKIKLDFFIKQKKEFSFRGKTYQIGGDVCLSNRIQLKGKNYLVFLNADAMGKSIQGAGGILVLGSVYESIIQRTHSYPVHSEVAPEKWIKQAFKEMHKVFETFDGSMLISLIFGLVDESNGLVYYINAEHPWLILYRDGVASFVEEKTYFRKLGHMGLKGEIIISTFQMKPGDLLIMGSDGKDDVVLDKSESSRQINENEELFLKRVEECKGDLKKIYETIQANYELIDDFSLLSIYYPLEDLKNFSQILEIQEIIDKARSLMKRTNDYTLVIDMLERAYEEKGREEKLVELLGLCYQKTQQYSKASLLYKDFLKYHDASTELLLQMVSCFKKTREFEIAIEISERIKLREPRNSRNLLHLADLYAYTRNYRKAKKILLKLLEFESSNEKARILLEKIESLESQNLFTV